MDFCIWQSSSINRTICSNFYIFAYNQLADLFYFYIAIFWGSITKTVWSQNSVVMNNTVLRNMNILNYWAIWFDSYIIFDNTIWPYNYISTNWNVITNWWITWNNSRGMNYFIFQFKIRIFKKLTNFCIY